MFYRLGVLNVFWLTVFSTYDGFTEMQPYHNSRKIYVSRWHETNQLFFLTTERKESELEGEKVLSCIYEEFS